MSFMYNIRFEISGGWICLEFAFWLAPPVDPVVGGHPRQHYPAKQELSVARETV